MPFQVVRNDIVRVKADAIVNTANPQVRVGPGVDSAIYEAAGRERLLAEREKIGVLQPGEAAVTPAFDLDAEYIIHVSGPHWQGGNRGEKEILRRCYDKALALAAEKGCTSIAFPLMASGAYGFPHETALRIAVSAFTDFLMEHEMDIILAVFKDESYRISGRLFSNVESFINEDYVDRAEMMEGVRPSMRRRERRRSTMNAREAIVSAEPMQSIAPSFTYSSLEDELKRIYKDSFDKHLRTMIKERNLKNAEVYTAANISKQYFSKLLKGQVNPSKEKMLALAVGLRLTPKEAEDFLGLAGYAFSPISQTDMVVRHFLKKREYSVMKIDLVLYDFGLEALSGPMA
ncbi:MAG: macro domain-containing protein [Solobacterium sp.]|nr:macro domain-containing protein [Solobacterium sp.]MBQ6593419.1 macro domain-containing protein [Solobacterium sp.]MBR0477739.1 macro domain-containing protein [Solobacterium sp.]